MQIYCTVSSGTLHCLLNRHQAGGCLEMTSSLTNVEFAVHHNSLSIMKLLCTAQLILVLLKFQQHRSPLTMKV